MRVVVANGDMYGTHYYVPTSALAALVPPGFNEAFVSTGQVCEETAEVQRVLDVLDADARVLRVEYDTASGQPGCMRVGGSAGAPENAPENAGVVLVPFPPGVTVSDQYVAILKGE